MDTTPRTASNADVSSGNPSVALLRLKRFWVLWVSGLLGIGALVAAASSEYGCLIVPAVYPMADCSTPTPPALVGIAVIAAVLLTVTTFAIVRRRLPLPAAGVAVAVITVVVALCLVATQPQLFLDVFVNSWSAQ